MKRERDLGSKEKGKSAEDIGMYLDHFLEDVVDLPSELQVDSFIKSQLARSFASLESSSLTLLQRKFKLIRELDEKCSENKGAIKEFHEGIMAGALKDSVLQETVKKMRGLHSECVTWGDEKMSLAIQAYDMVDNRIRQLDLDLRRFEQELATDPKFKESLDKLRCANSSAKVGSGRKKKATNVADLDVEVDRDRLVRRFDAQRWRAGCGAGGNHERETAGCQPGSPWWCELRLRHRLLLDCGRIRNR